MEHVSGMKTYFIQSIDFGRIIAWRAFLPPAGGRVNRKAGCQVMLVLLADPSMCEAEVRLSQTLLRRWVERQM